MSDGNQQIIDEFRRSGGQVGGPFEGVGLLLLTTAGARTGRPHTTPLVYREDTGRLLVFASNAGRPHNPSWYHNVLANPYVRVEHGTEIRRMTAQVLSGAAREEEYVRQAALDPAFAVYESATTRTIPVIALTPDDRARALGDELVKIHAAFRAQLAALLSGTTPGPTLEDQLLESCLTVCHDLHDHHTNENDRGFPLLERRFPGITPVLERLRREHETIAKLREELERTHDPMRLKHLAAELEAHFDHEERELITALNTL